MSLGVLQLSLRLASLESPSDQTLWEDVLEEKSNDETDKAGILYIWPRVGSVKMGFLDQRYCVYESIVQLLVPLYLHCQHGNQFYSRNVSANYSPESMFLQKQYYE